jgi:hypothetical protein
MWGNQEGKISVPKFSKVNIIYVWALIFVAMALYAFTWFVMGLPLITFIQAAKGVLSIHDAMWEQVVDFILICFEIHPIIALVGWFIYGILNSAKRDVETWRV